MSTNNSTARDKAGQNDDKRLVEPPIDVTVRPKQDNLPKKGDPARPKVEQQNERNRETADKVKRQLQQDVKKAVDGASGGKQSQLDAAKKAGDEAAKQVNSNAVKEIKVNVAGNETTHKPAEGPPPPAAPAPAPSLPAGQAGGGQAPPPPKPSGKGI